jgi:hypothetical protein
VMGCIDNAFQTNLDRQRTDRPAGRQPDPARVLRPHGRAAQPHGLPGLARPRRDDRGLVPSRAGSRASKSPGNCARCSRSRSARAT